MFCPNGLVNLFLLTQRFCVPTWKGHYVTGPDIAVFSNVACVENNLTALTSKCGQLFSGFKNYSKPSCHRSCVINKDKQSCFFS